MENLPNQIEVILDQYPFLTYGHYTIGSEDTQEYLGIIQNSDSQLISMYILDLVPNVDQRMEFLKHGETWWWESNRQIPINLFLNKEMSKFRDCIRHFNAKEFQIVKGHSVNLSESTNKRIRKKQKIVTWVKKLD